MTTGQDWQTRVGRSWADMHQQTDRSFAGLTDRLLSVLGSQPGDHVLDVGCGAGELSLALARARPNAEIIGLDISDHLTVVANHRANGRRSPRFVTADAASWSEAGFAPDLIVSRHGVMFFDDPVAAFSHLRSIARPAARLTFTCFRPARENSWSAGLAQIGGGTSGPAPAPGAPGPFAFSDPRKVEQILSAAGWGAADFEPVDFAYIAGTGADACEEAFAFFSRIGPAAAALAALDGDARAAKEAQLRSWIAQNRSDNLVAFQAAAWIVTAHAQQRTQQHTRQ